MTSKYRPLMASGWVHSSAKRRSGETVRCDMRHAGGAFADRAVLKTQHAAAAAFFLIIDSIAVASYSALACCNVGTDHGAGRLDGQRLPERCGAAADTALAVDHPHGPAMALLACSTPLLTPKMPPFFMSPATKTMVLPG